ncbi:intraflagellar transport protein 81 homolog [Culicoides brevitarsis]|uniref:intraflagellar transport protein 81 homolog n=1 Tax=Culicoides brevitarsis TaxID=469753 RepID=UPI00307CB3AE
MTENLKIIVQEVNSLLGTDYNLISFDSLSPELLLQCLVDVFAHFDACEKFEIKDTDPEESNRRIIDALRKIQYRPENVDLLNFKTLLVHGDKKVVHPILGWIVENKERVKKTTYLARFLIPLNLPSEAIAIPEVSNIWNQYQSIMDDFKEAHKSYEQSRQEGAQTRELRSDIGAIEIEIENVKKRIERTQGRLDKVPQQELLLEAAHNLRIERERQKELQSQIDEQKQGLQRSNVVQERFKKELNNARLAAQGASPQNLLESLIEEVQVLEFMVQQKLPQELLARQTEVQIFEEVLKEPNLSRDYLFELQTRVEEINSEVQRLVETKMNERGTQNDTLGPFRQQAAIVMRKKEQAAEALDQASTELREIEAQLQEKQAKLQNTVGETILRGDDLKQFVNTLRAKSNVYKEQRAKLAAMRAETADLQQTLANLKAQDPSLNVALAQHEDESLSLTESRAESPSVDGHGMTELSRLIDGLQRAIQASRERITPLTQQLRPLRERVTDLRDDRDSKKQAFNALSATLSAEQATMQSEINEATRNIKKLEENWQDLQVEYERLNMLMENTKKKDAQDTVRETLSKEISQQEKLRSKYGEEKTYLTESREIRAKQQELWSDVCRLFEVKARCFKEAKSNGIGGTMSLTKDGAETFTLQ